MGIFPSLTILFNLLQGTIFPLFTHARSFEASPQGFLHPASFTDAYSENPCVSVFNIFYYLAPYGGFIWQSRLIQLLISLLRGFLLLLYAAFCSGDFEVLRGFFTGVSVALSSSSDSSEYETLPFRLRSSLPSLGGLFSSIASSSASEESSLIP
mgnify:CR=1 FL=1